MTRASFLASLLVFLAACGGGGPGSPSHPHPPDEVSEEWTSGDDAPLDDDGSKATKHRAR